MDLLSHVFLPLTAAYVLRREFFSEPWRFGVVGFALLADFDKFLGSPGLLHSLVTLVPICAALLAIEYGYRGELLVAPMAVAFVGSHLVLDFVDGGPVPLLFPFVKAGIGLTYPVDVVFGAGPVGVAFDGAPVAIRNYVPRQGYNTYSLVKSAGVASLLLFLTVFVGERDSS